jgi:integrase
MPKRAITQLFLDRITPPEKGRVEYWDTAQPGLHLRLSSSGTASWAVMYRVGGKQVRETLGTVADISKVTEARRLAELSIEVASKGVNPVEKRRDDAARAAKNTVAAAVEAFLRERAADKNWRDKTKSGHRQIFEHDVIPAWGDRPVSSITDGDVLALLKKKRTGRDRRHSTATGGARVQGNRVLTRLHTFFRWAVREKLIESDPTADIEKTTETSRDRVLTDGEIKMFWQATETINPTFRAMFRLLLLTGQRVNEVGGTTASEVDLDTHQWTLPATRSKNGKAHVVHLSAMAMAVIKTVLPAGKRDALGVLPSETARPKARVAAAMGAPHWVLHDLRRTATTLLARLGVEPHVADRVLNHTQGTIHGVAKTYNKFQYLDERRLALEALGKFVELLVEHDIAPHIAEARVKLWLRTERERGEREAASNVVDLPLAAAPERA